MNLTDQHVHCSCLLIPSIPIIVPVDNLTAAQHHLVLSCTWCTQLSLVLALRLLTSLLAPLKSREHPVPTTNTTGEAVKQKTMTKCNGTAPLEKILLAFPTIGSLGVQLHRHVVVDIQLHTIHHCANFTQGLLHLMPYYIC